MTKISEADTKTLILDAAEQAFADLGFDAASLRHIISVAGVNLASIHYHFGSKEALIAAVFQRRIDPLNQERLKRLDAIEKAAGEGPLQVEAVIEALVGPALRLASDPTGRGLMRLFGRTLAEPSEYLQKLLNEQFGGIMIRFTRAFGRALPHLPRAVLFWRIQFVIGAMGQIMCDPQNLKVVSKGMCDPQDTATVLKEMVAFLSAGMSAPAPSGRPSRSQLVP
jgi:AcrR family transcriptional regulator